MKTYKYILSIVLFVAAIISCNEDEFGSDDFVSTVTAPANLAVLFDVTQDNTGLVTVTPNSEGAVSYSITFGDETADPITVKQGENTQHTYAEGNYEVKIVAAGITGLTAELTQQLVVSFRAPENLEITAAVDPSNPFVMNVSATADYATSFLVFFDSSNEDEEGTPLSIDGTVSFEYPAVGDYTIKVVALSGGVETTELTEVVTVSSPIEFPVDFEIFDASKFIGFGGASGSIVDNPDTNGNESAKVGQIIKGGPEVWAGDVIIMSAPIDFSTKKIIKLDVWSPRPGGKLLFKLENLDDPGIFIEKEVTLVGNSAWEEVLIDFSDIDVSQTYQKLVWFFDFGTVGDGSADWTFYVDNIKQVASIGGYDELLTNGDYESGTESWNISEDNLVTDAGNTYYSVDVAEAGDPWSVNMSQVLEIAEGEVYTLTFDAWSDTDRSIIAGIGLNAGPWTADTETVNITTAKIRYSIVVNSIDEPFGAPDARVIFDMGADAGQVNIDNVSLISGEVIFDEGLLTNGDYESGTESWNISEDNLVTDAGNTYYSVDVAEAGDPWSVNMSQVLEIAEGEVYTLTFDAWSDTDRSIIAGIGLNAGPWTADTETVNITTAKIRYSIVVNSIDEPFGAPDARVIFDMGADVGSVNIDNVSLFLN